MRRYLAVFLIDWQNQFVYRLNFLLWRLRNILRLLMTFFLWKGIYQTGSSVFGFSQPQIFTYVLLVLLVQSVILSAPSADNIGGEIGSGDLSNYLVKPISYLKYWFVRDLSSKLLNVICALIEIFILWLIFRPELVLHFSVSSLMGFLLICLVSVPAYYFLSLLTRFISFWNPENTWGLSFLIIIFIETLAGSIFPLDILPDWGKLAVQFTPFPYLIYYPVAIFLGKITGFYLLRILLQAFIWMLILFFLARLIWIKGLRVYGAEGK